MATFKKAKPQQAKLRLSFYGPPGSGKTFTALLVAEGLAKREAKRIAYIDTEESGTDFYAMPVPERRVHPEAFDFDVLKTQSLSDAIRGVKSLDPGIHGVIVVDSISHLWEAAMAAAEHTSKGTVKFSEWTKVKRPYKGLVKWLIESPFHVLICGRQKNVFEDDEVTGDIKKVGVTMQAERDTQYEPQACIRLEAKVNKKDTTRSIYYAYVEKDRTGVLAGRTLANLTYSDFEKVIALLGGDADSQVRLPDPDDTAQRDAELIEQGEEEVRARKAARSGKHLATYSKRIQEAADAKALAEIADELKTKRGQLLEEHRKVLLDAYESRVSEVNKEKA